MEEIIAIVVIVGGVILLGFLRLEQIKRYKKRRMAEALISSSREDQPEEDRSEDEPQEDKPKEEHRSSFFVKALKIIGACFSNAIIIWVIIIISQKGAEGLWGKWVELITVRPWLFILPAGIFLSAIVLSLIWPKKEEGKSEDDEKKEKQIEVAVPITFDDLIEELTQKKRGRFAGAKRFSETVSEDDSKPKEKESGPGSQALWDLRMARAKDFWEKANKKGVSL